jgi:cellulose synthase operon protein C
MADVTEDALRERPPWLVTIRLTPDGPPNGAGFLAPGGLVVTCAHVVDPRAAEAPTQPVYIQVKHADAHDPIPATALADGWFPTRGSAGDVAVLRLDGPLPAGAAPVRLAEPGDALAGHRLRAYGFTAVHPAGVPADLTAVGYAEDEWFAVRSEQPWGQAVAPGFSGTPLWDRELRAVIGMVNTRDTGRADTDAHTAYAIGAPALIRYWPALAAAVRPAVPAALLAEIDRGLARPLREERLPRLSEFGMIELGVSPSLYMRSDDQPRPRYLPRPDTDRELDAAFAAQQVVLVAGPEAAGKSRAVYELLARSGDPALIVPRPGTDLERLFGLPLPVEPGRTVVWLDDFDSFLKAGGLTPAALDALRRLDPGAVVVGTISLANFESLTAQHATTQVYRSLVARIKPVVYLTDDVLQAEQRAEAAEAYPDIDFAEAGVAAQLVASELLAEQVRKAFRVEPVAWAVIRAAVDWRRVRMTQPVPEEVLRRLAGAYVARTRRPGPVTDEEFAEALAWATRPPADYCPVAAVRVVQDGGTSGYRIFSSLLAAARQDPDGSPVDDALWDELIAYAPTSDLLMIGLIAEDEGRDDVTQRALDRAELATDRPEDAAWAAYIKGVALKDEGRAEEAIVSLRRAAALDGTDAQQPALMTLATVLFVLGRSSEASRLLEELGDAALRPADLEHEPDVQPLIQTTQAVAILREQRPTAGGELPDLASGERPSSEAELRAVLRAAGRQTIAELTPLTQMGLSALAVDTGDLNRARRLLEQAAASTASTALAARVTLGALLVESEPDRAERLLGEGLESADDALRFQARLGVALLDAVRGDTSHAIDRLTEAIHAAPSDQAGEACVVLGELLMQHGDNEAARAAFEQAAGSENLYWSATALLDLFVLAVKEDDEASAEDLLRRAMAAPVDMVALKARSVYGDLLRYRGDVEGAREAYQQVIDSDDRSWAPVAKFDMATLIRDEEPERAQRLLAEVAEQGPGLHASRARDLLGDWLRQEDDVEGARQNYLLVIEYGDPDIVPMSLYSLAQIEADSGNRAAAVRYLTDGAERDGDEERRANARIALALLTKDTDRAAARETLAAAADGGGQRGLIAARLLAGFAVEDGDPDRADAWLDRFDELALDDVAAARVGHAYRSVVAVRRAAADPQHAAELDLERLVRDGACLFETDDIDGAEEVLTAARAHAQAGSADRTAADVQCGRVRLLRGMTDRDERDELTEAGRAELVEAERLLRCGLGVSGLDETARLPLSQALRWLERPREALEVLAPLAQAAEEPHRAEVLIELGELAEITGADGGAAAMDYYRAAAETGDPEIALTAFARLDELERRAAGPALGGPGERLRLLSGRAEPAGPAGPTGFEHGSGPASGSAPASTSASVPEHEPPAAPVSRATGPAPLPAAARVALGLVAQFRGDEAEAAAWWQSVSVLDDSESRGRAAALLRSAAGEPGTGARP